MLLLSYLYLLDSELYMYTVHYDSVVGCVQVFLISMRTISRSCLKQWRRGSLPSVPTAHLQIQMRRRLRPSWTVQLSLRKRNVSLKLHCKKSDSESKIQISLSIRYYFVSLPNALHATITLRPLHKASFGGATNSGVEVLLGTFVCWDLFNLWCITRLNSLS